jgi:Zn-dependent protease
MKSSIKLGHVFGVELGLHYSWFIIALLIVVSLADRFAHAHPTWGPGVVWGTAVVTGILFFGGIYVHELSHALVAKARGLPIHKITLFLLGGMAQIEKESSDASTEFWMGIAGPLTSIVLGIILLVIAVASGFPSKAISWLGPRTEPASPGNAILVWLGYINIWLGAFNMIPGFPLDGGRVLRGIIWWITNNGDKATRAATTIGQIIAVLFIGWGIYLFFAGLFVSGIWMAFIGWFLLQAAGATRLRLQAENFLEGLRVRDVMSQDCTQIGANLPLQDLVENYLFRTGRRCFVVMDNANVTGLITPNEVAKVDRAQWPITPVRAAMRPLSQIHSVRADASVISAMELMTNEDVNQLPVMSNGHLEGIVSRGHILQLLQSRAALAPRS